MPGRDAILAIASDAARTWWPIAIAWHIALAVALIALWRGWRPSRRRTGRVIALPLGSVAAIAWHSGNPFNATVFAVVAAWLAWQSARFDDERFDNEWMPRRRDLTTIAAFTLIAFGWVYPHFLDGGRWSYLIAAPFGVLPCPTLAVVIGIVLLLRQFDSTAFGVGIASIGLAYGLLGVFFLQVRIDAVLIAGATLLLLTARSTRRARRRDVPDIREVAA